MKANYEHPVQMLYYVDKLTIERKKQSKANEGEKDTKIS